MYLGYIHCFRAIAIAFIVSGHTIDMFLWLEKIETVRILRILISNGSVLFVFIAGYLFQHLLVKYDTKKYYLSKIKNVIIPYIIISIPAIVIFVFILNRESVWQNFYDNPKWIQILLFYLTGYHLAPLWFIPMIFLFYVIAPLLRIADNGNSIYYFLPLFIVLSCLIGRGSLPPENFVHFFSVYLLGMFCSKYKNTINPLIQKTYFLVSSGIATLMFALAEFYFMTDTMSYLNYLQKLFMSIFLLGIFIRNSKLHSNYINTVADVSFGIFFIHSYVISSFKLIYKLLFHNLPNGYIYIYINIYYNDYDLCIFSS